MATTIFENIVDSNFGDKRSSKGVSFGQKTDSSEFRDLVKRKFALIFNKKSSIPIVYKRIEAVLFLLKSRH